MNNNARYDVGIVGGGLAGLALGIQCAQQGYRTILFEKERYPFHKVCGEYVSFESWNFLEELGVPLSQMELPVIRRLRVTAPGGKVMEHDLPLGGFGISRHRLDSMLCEIAKSKGVDVQEETRVTDIQFAEGMFSVQSSTMNVECRVVAGTFGKRSNLDVKWKRRFVLQKPNKLNNYIGVKYHISTAWPRDLIALHNFKNGYCGISQVEDAKCCFCYLTTARNLERCNNSVSQMERQVLYDNPHIKAILNHATMLYAKPITISQISFARKTLVQDHVLMIGDAAGMITPLCGNGMSMAMHGSKIAFNQLRLFLKGTITRLQMEQEYTAAWKQQFGKRLRMGRVIQRFFGSVFLSGLLISILKRFPSLTDRLISETHGQPF